jgi:hypothetical protein
VASCACRPADAADTPETAPPHTASRDNPRDGWSAGQSRIHADGGRRATGDLICDPFVGGGTVGKAAVLLGRRFVGLDCDATALAHTARRLRRVSAADVVQSPLELVESPLRLRPCQRCRREFPTQRPHRGLLLARLPTSGLSSADASRNGSVTVVSA